MTVKPVIFRLFPYIMAQDERVVLSGQWKYGYFSMAPVAAMTVGDILICTVRGGGGVDGGRDLKNIHNPLNICMRKLFALFAKFFARKLLNLFFCNIFCTCKEIFWHCGNNPALSGLANTNNCHPIWIGASGRGCRNIRHRAPQLWSADSVQKRAKSGRVPLRLDDGSGWWRLFIASMLILYLINFWHGTRILRETSRNETGIPFPDFWEF